MAQGQFHWLDYVLFVGTIVAALAIGVYNAFSASAKKNAMDYLTGSRQMSVIPIALSIMMSGFSSISVLGNTAEMYFHGTQMFWTSTAGCIGSYLSTHLFVPIYFHLKAITCFQYFDWRYDSMVLRRLASTISIVLWIFYAGACAYAPSIALSGITEIPLWAGIFCTAVIGTIYTAIGGLRAVIWTDAFQAIVLFTGILAVVIVGAIEVGGLSKVFEIADAGGRLRFFDMNIDITQRTSFWSTTIPFLLVNLTIVPSVQTTVQRIQASGSEYKAKASLYIQAPLWIVMDGLFLMCGLTIYAYYESVGCDPYRSYQIYSSNQILPYFIVDVLNFPGLPGLFIAVLFSGALSSVSSSLNAVAALVWLDFLAGFFPNVSETTKKLANIGLTILAGFLSLLLAWAVTTFDTHILQVVISWSSGLGSPVAALCLLGAAFPWTQWRGASIGLFFGVFLTSWINVGQYMTPHHLSYLNTTVDDCSYPYNYTSRPISPDDESVFGLYKVSFLWIGALGWTTTFVVGLIASFFTCPEDPKLLDPRLLIPWGKSFCCCVGETKGRELCWCGARHDQNEILYPELRKTDDNNMRIVVGYENYAIADDMKVIDDEKKTTDGAADVNSDTGSKSTSTKGSEPPGYDTIDEATIVTTRF